ncbi:Twin-arginine translocation protein TatB [Halomonas citrativorans]|uniref:Sec-independent protein translocase protein TatB n=1 Tax=Halomonas citrativorans TaxID=2742612 RepID=A0A1R4HRB6_9GAMM|nr:Sec-independent protein translocase protein TatB [Halomonas citrativorans]MBE0403907.1 twin-arginine translocase subunit TatB [Halomonas citrativorans]SJN10046.1 Twin-arginine translocation protein TatB [Halomonas citrativorans]
MLDIGFLELMLVGVVGLLVLGPERLPRAARTAGLWVGKIKRTISGMQREISAQLEAEELRQTLNEQQKTINDSLKNAKKDVESILDAPSSRSTSSSASQSETEQRVAQASAQLDEAQREVNEAASHTSNEPLKATSKKDSQNP